MELGDRKKKILRVIIERYIDTAEPVGSKVIAAESGLSLSPATIRNEMAELESMGLLEQPHTSAGRIPTPWGYRIYVNELMQAHRLSLEETRAINQALKSKMRELDRIIAEAGQIASRMTSYPVYSMAAVSRDVTIKRFDLILVDSNTFIIVVMLSSNVVKNKLVHLPVQLEPEMIIKLSTVFNASFTGITEDKITTSLISAAERSVGDTIGLTAVIAGFAIELLEEASAASTYVTGASHLFEHPEYRDVDKAQRLLQYLSDREELARLPAPEDEGGMKIVIGPENVAEELKDSSVIVAKYEAGDGVQGLIGVVGPTRMDYSKVAARLEYIARGIGLLLSGGEAPPGLKK